VEAVTPGVEARNSGLRVPAGGLLPLGLAGQPPGLAGARGEPSDVGSGIVPGDADDWVVGLHTLLQPGEPVVHAVLARWRGVPPYARNRRARPPSPGSGQSGRWAA